MDLSCATLETYDRISSPIMVTCTKLGKKLLGSIAGTILIGITLAVVMVAVLLTDRYGVLANDPRSCPKLQLLSACSLPGWTDDTKTSMLNAENSNLNRLANEKGVFSGKDRVFLRKLMCPHSRLMWVADLYFDIVKTYLDQLCDLSEDVQMASLNGSTGPYYGTHLASTSSVPGWSSRTQSSAEVAAWWQCNSGPSAPSTACDGTNNRGVSSVNAVGSTNRHAGYMVAPHLKALASAELPLGQGGFWGSAAENDGMLTLYPFQSRPTFGSDTYSCEHPDYSGPANEKRGYDPRCRPWYLGARSSTKAFFTAPYLFAGSGELGITAAKGYGRSSALAPPTGVCMLDFSFNPVAASVQQRILDNGYGYLIKTNREAVAHPKLNFAQPPDNLDVRVFEFGSTSSSEAQDFTSAVLDEMTELTSGTATYQKDGEPWVVAWRNVSSAGYSMALTVPQADIEAPFREAEDSINSAVSTMIGIIVAVLVVVLLLLVYVGLKVVHAIVDPVQNLNSLLTMITQNNFDGEFPVTNEDLRTREMALLADVFEQLFTVVKIGHANLLGGDVDAARSTYKDALELFQRMGHEKGVGVCFTNLGGAALMQKHFGEAIAFYTRAVQNAEFMIQSHIHRGSKAAAAGNRVSAGAGHTENPVVPANGTPSGLQDVPLDSPDQLPPPAAGAGAPSMDAAMGNVQGMSVTMAAGEAEEGEGGLTPAPQSDPAHAELLLQLASRQSNLAKAYLARARIVTDVTLLRSVGADVSDKQQAAYSELGADATPTNAQADCMCALDILEAAARNYAAAHAALPMEKEAQTHADAASTFSEGALVCAHLRLEQRAADFARCAHLAHNLYMAIITAPGFTYTDATQSQRVQLECRLLAADAMPLVAAGNHADGLRALEFSLTSGTVADPAWDNRILWLMAELLHELGQADGAKQTLSLVGGGSSGPRDYVFVLDKSGSMSGSLMNKAMDNMLALYDKHLRASDRLAFIVFNHQVHVKFHFQEKGAGAQAAAIRKQMDRSRSTGGTTACYDAISEAVAMFARDSRSGTSSGRGQVVVALTDGEDNSSSNTPETLKREFTSGAGKSTQLIMVGVGRLSNAGKLRSLCEASRKGAYVEATGGASSLDAAFQAVAEAMVDVNIESL